MGFHNTNWTAVPLVVGTYDNSVLGDGLKQTIVHEFFCTSDGSITITARGGGEFTWSAKSSESVKIMAAKVVVTSGVFVGFRAANNRV